MIIRHGIMALALWTLLLAPFLCGSGVLTHSCICEDSYECPHELQCSADPCQILAFNSISPNSRAENSTLPVDQINPPALVNDAVALPEIQKMLIAGPVGSLPEVVVPDRCLPLIC